MRYPIFMTAFCAVSATAGAIPAMAQASVDQPAAAATSAPVLRPYRINPGDELEINVWGEERLQKVVKVLPDGSFSYPLAGHIDALNKLPRDIEAAITAGLRSQYRDQVPNVTVSVRVPAGMQFSVAGKVRSPGAFTASRYINVLEAVSLAGGPADFADVGNVTILRKGPTGLSVIKVRLSDIMKGAPNQRELASLPQIETGDTVIVP